MKTIFEDYGRVIIVALAIVALIGISVSLTPMVKSNFESLNQSFFKQVDDVDTSGSGGAGGAGGVSTTPKDYGEKRAVWQTSTDSFYNAVYTVTLYNDNVMVISSSNGTFDEGFPSRDYELIYDDGKWPPDEYPFEYPKPIDDDGCSYGLNYSNVSFVFEKGTTSLSNLYCGSDNYFEDVTYYIPSTVTSVDPELERRDCGHFLTCWMSNNFTIYCETEAVKTLVENAYGNHDLPTIIVDASKF